MPRPGRAKALTYAVRFRVLARYGGQMMIVLGIVAAAPLIVAVGFGDFEFAWRIGLAGLALGGLGFAASRVEAPERVQANESLVLVALIFLVGALAMTPVTIHAGLSPIDALFESISGITTTGLTTTASVEEKGPVFLFTRAWMQWYGGLGIVALSVMLLTHPGIAGKRLALAAAEAEDPVGGTKAHFKRIVLVYVALTAAAWVTIWMLSGDWFDALLYTLTAVSTGGFAPHDGSLAAIDSYAVQVAVMVFALGGGISLVFYRQLRQRGWKEVSDNSQLHALLLLALIVTAALIASMRFADGRPWSEVLRDAPLLGFSAQTTTGFTPIAVDTLRDTSKAVLMFAMTIGGGVSSTAGGVKILRLLIILSVVRTIIRCTALPPHGVLEPRVYGRQVRNEEVREAATIMALVAAVIALSWLPFLMYGYDPIDALFEVVSATGTVGLTTGVARPDLEPALKLVLCADMLMGRLEVVAWIVLLGPRTWIGKRVNF